METGNLPKQHIIKSVVIQNYAALRTLQINSELISAKLTMEGYKHKI